MALPTDTTEKTFWGTCTLVVRLYAQILDLMSANDGTLIKPRVHFKSLSCGDASVADREIDSGRQ